MTTSPLAEATSGRHEEGVVSVARPLLLRARRPDAVTLLTLFLALQFVIPARQVVGGLGAAGRPSSLVGLGLLLLAFASWLIARPDARQWFRQPIRWVVGTFVVVQLVTYVAGIDRGLPGVESRSADRWLLVVLGLVGVTLAVCNGVPTRARLEVLLRRLIALTGFMAAVGLVQALSGFDPATWLRLPGLTLNNSIIGISSRGGLPRVAGTAGHYIELGVVCAMALPLALHLLIFARSSGQRLRSLLVVVLIAGGIAFSLSRSAIITVAVGLLVLAAGWSWEWRARGLLAGSVVVGGAVLFSGSWLETITELFFGSGEDPSIQTRLSDYAEVYAYFVERPWLGRGAGTFLPDRYLLLDNQYLGTIASSGLLGLLGLVVLLVGPILVGAWIRRRSEDPSDRHLALALMAGMSVAVVASGTFDSLGFSTFAGVLFIYIGSLGALYRFTALGAGAAPMVTTMTPTTMTPTTMTPTTMTPRSRGASQ